MGFGYAESLSNSFVFQEAQEEEGKNDHVLRKLQESVDSNPDDASLHFNLVMFLVTMMKRISGFGSPLVGIFSYEFENVVSGGLLVGKGGTRVEGKSCGAFCKISQIKSAEWGRIQIFGALLGKGIR